MDSRTHLDDHTRARIVRRINTTCILNSGVLNNNSYFSHLTDILCSQSILNADCNLAGETENVDIRNISNINFTHKDFPNTMPMTYAVKNISNTISNTTDLILLREIEDADVRNISNVTAFPNNHLNTMSYMSTGSSYQNVHNTAINTPEEIRNPGEVKCKQCLNS